MARPQTRRSLLGKAALVGGGIGALARPEPAHGEVLDGAVGWLECELGGELEAGDHTLFLGRVEHVEPGADKPPLLRLGGDYRPA